MQICLIKLEIKIEEKKLLKSIKVKINGILEKNRVQKNLHVIRVIIWVSLTSNCHKIYVKNIVYKLQRKTLKKPIYKALITRHRLDRST